jgi:hypothetical protein
MNLKRILIDESEKNRILEMHSGNKSLITEATAADFPECVRYAGKITMVPQEVIIALGYPLSAQLYAVVVVDPSTKYTYHWLAKPKVIVAVPTDSKDTRKPYIKSYHCGCKNGTLKPITRTYDGKSMEDEKKSNCVSDKIKVPENEICKLPGDKVWVYSKKGDTWYASKDGGKTWIKLDPIKFKSAIDLLNSKAVCGGTVPGGEQNEACKTKCAAVPLQPGQVGPQVQGWFYSRDGVCYEATGTGGFASKDECEACKCGSQTPIGDGGQKPGDGGQKPGDGGQKPGDGGQKPSDGGQKLPDFIPPTINKPSKPLD